MKLRATTNSIRIRIRKSELKQLSETGMVEESINLGNATVFKFALAVSENITKTEASLTNNYLRIDLPGEEAKAWINSNQVGIEVDNQITPNELLHLLIEKDFPCLDRPNEDKSDTFWELASETPEAC